MDNLTFGRYTHFNTFIHKLDPRNKIFLMVILMVGIFFQFTMWSTALIMSGVYLVILIILMLISRVSILSLFKSLSSMWFMILILMIMYIFMPSKNNTIPDPAFVINGYAVYWDSFCRAGYIILRLMMMISLTMILTSTTRPMDMTYAFEWFMIPLKAIKFPVHEIAMTLSIALRFIPTLLEETNRIMKAQESRGADFAHGFMRRFKAIISLMIPLFVSAIQRSEELANAMEARGYDPRAKRTKYRLLTFSWRDAIGFIIGAGIFAGIIFLFVLDQNSKTGVDILQTIFKVKGF